MGLERLAYALNGASWGSIFAGGVTSIALSIIMALLGMALGFAVVKPKSEHPASRLGMAFGGWSALSVIVSMAGGGFMAGVFAGQRGMEHGFMVWALVLLMASLFGGLAVGSAVRLVGSMVKGFGSGAADVAAVVSKGAAQAASGIIAELRDNVHLTVDSDKLTGDIAGVLRDTGVETLQPDYLRQQMREARSDLRTALHQLAETPDDAEKIVSGFMETEKSRLEALGQDIDREAAVNAVMGVRKVPRDEAEVLVDDALKAYAHIRDKAREALTDARIEMEDAWKCLKDLAAQAREKADQWVSTASKTALAAALALIVAAVISMSAGAWGARHSDYWQPPQKTWYMR